MKSKTFKFQTFICLFAYLLICLLPPKAGAEGISLSVAPAILQIEVIPPADAHAPFSVQNLSNEPIDLKIGYKLFKASDKDDGQIEYLRDTDAFTGANSKIFEQIQVVDEDNLSIDSISLGPKQKKGLILRVIAPKKEPFSDYYFSLIFMNETKSIAPDISADESGTDTSQADVKQKRSTSSGTKAGIAINVLLSVGPKDAAKGYIEEFSTPWYREAGPVPFTIKVKNTGSHFITPKGIILIKNMFGQTVGRVDLAEDNILTATSRYLTNAKQSLQPTTYNLQPKATWSDTFLLGPYTAQLSLAIPGQAEIYTRSIYFLALPIKLLLGITIAIIVVVLAYLRVKKGLAK